MRIGIIGAGFIGRAVARLAIAHGHEVMLSNSRSPRTLGSAMVSIRCAVGTTKDAAEFGDLVLLAVPFFATQDIDPTFLSGKILMDAGNYYPMRDGQIEALDKGQTTTSEITQQHFAAAKVVKAFNAILEGDIETTGSPTGSINRRALPIAGDDEQAKLAVATLLDSVGFDVVDSGPLKEGWRFERARPAYCVPKNDRDLREALVSAGEMKAEGSWRLAT